MDVVGAAIRVGAGPLPGRRIEVDPSLGEGALCGGRILVAERLQRRHDVLFRFVGGVGEVDRGHERGVEVVVVELGQPHHALAQRKIAVEGRQVPVHPVDEPHVHRRRDVGGIERALERALVVARLGVELVRLHLAIQSGAERAAEAAERAEERRHDLLAIAAVRERSGRD